MIRPKRPKNKGVTRASGSVDAAQAASSNWTAKIAKDAKALADVIGPLANLASLAVE